MPFDFADIERLVKKTIRGNPGLAKFAKMILKLLEFYPSPFVQQIRSWVVEVDQLLKDGTGPERRDWVAGRAMELFPDIDKGTIDTVIQLAYTLLPRKLKGQIV